MLHFMNARDSEEHSQKFPEIARAWQRSWAPPDPVLLPGSSVLLAARAGAPRPAYGFKA